MILLCCANTKEAAAGKVLMTKEQSDLSYEWWLKLAPTRNKFVRDTVFYSMDKNDIEQECYFQLLKALELYDESLGVPFESYYKVRLYGWRANQNRKRYISPSFIEDEALGLIDERMNLEEQIEEQVLFEKVIEELSTLKEIERKIIVAYYLENKKLTEIAKALGLKYKTAESKKGEVLKKLKKRLTSHYKD